jgi:hypothetical protein
VFRTVWFIERSTILAPYRGLHELLSMDVELICDILLGDDVFDELSLQLLDDRYGVFGYVFEWPYSRSVFDGPVGADAEYEVGESVRSEQWTFRQT